MFNMLCPEMVNGLYEDPEPIVQGELSTQRVKLLKPPVKSLGFRALNYTFTDKMVEFKKETPMEMIHSHRQDRHEVDQLRL